MQKSKQHAIMLIYCVLMPIGCFLSLLPLVIFVLPSMTEYDELSIPLYILAYSLAFLIGMFWGKMGSKICNKILTADCKSAIVQK